MEVDKLKEWLDVAQQFQSEKFWNQIFNDHHTTSSSTNLSQTPLTTVKEYLPKCDLFENDNKLVIEAEIPGLAKEDLHISVHQQLLTISGEFKALKQNCKYYLKERTNRTFKKEITLPYPILVTKITTEIRDGILYIIMPFLQEDVENIPIGFD
ncbi:Hsp20/alpha crystallin family protein [Neobacillus soli]|uniref:Hsp20/alpha crystallin family protein n=1 Tax=Neobacillus soli TaxID=220688 RepID=UPI000824CE9F|nr:Hsp20/alpha crystallin family protein [Neobacillus soli]